MPKEGEARYKEVEAGEKEGGGREMGDRLASRAGWAQKREKPDR